MFYFILKYTIGVEISLLLSITKIKISIHPIKNKYRKKYISVRFLYHYY